MKNFFLLNFYIQLFIVLIVDVLLILTNDKPEILFIGIPALFLIFIQFIPAILFIMLFKFKHNLLYSIYITLSTIVLGLLVIKTLTYLTGNQMDTSDFLMALIYSGIVLANYYVIVSYFMTKEKEVKP